MNSPHEIPVGESASPQTVRPEDRGLFELETQPSSVSPEPLPFTTIQNEGAQASGFELPSKPENSVLTACKMSSVMEFEDNGDLSFGPPRESGDEDPSEDGFDAGGSPDLEGLGMDNDLFNPDLILPPEPLPVPDAEIGFSQEPVLGLWGTALGQAQGRSTGTANFDDSYPMVSNPTVSNSIGFQDLQDATVPVQSSTSSQNVAAQTPRASNCSASAVPADINPSMADRNEQARLQRLASIDKNRQAYDEYDQEQEMSQQAEMDKQDLFFRYCDPNNTNLLPISNPRLSGPVPTTGITGGVQQKTNPLQQGNQVRQVHNEASSQRKQNHNQNYNQQKQPKKQPKQQPKQQPKPQPKQQPKQQQKKQPNQQPRQQQNHPKKSKQQQQNTKQDWERMADHELRDQQEFARSQYHFHPRSLGTSQILPPFKISAQNVAGRTVSQPSSSAPGPGSSQVGGKRAFGEGEEHASHDSKRLMRYHERMDVDGGSAAGPGLQAQRSEASIPHEDIGRTVPGCSMTDLRLKALSCELVVKDLLKDLNAAEGRLRQSQMQNVDLQAQVANQLEQQEEIACRLRLAEIERDRITRQLNVLKETQEGLD